MSAAGWRQVACRYNPPAKFFTQLHRKPLNELAHSQGELLWGVCLGRVALEMVVLPKENTLLGEPAPQGDFHVQDCAPRLLSVLPSKTMDVPAQFQRCVEGVSTGDDLCENPAPGEVPEKDVGQHVPRDCDPLELSGRADLPGRAHHDHLLPIKRGRSRERPDAHTDSAPISAFHGCAGVVHSVDHGRGWAGKESHASRQSHHTEQRRQEVPESHDHFLVKGLGAAEGKTNRLGCSLRL